MPSHADHDPAALARLDRLGGPGFATRIIDIFLRDGPRHVGDARAAADARDAKRLAYCAHAVVSSAANLGATEFAGLARGLEHQALAGTWDAIPASVEAFERAFGALRARLEAERAAREGT